MSEQVKIVCERRVLNENNTLAKIDLTANPPVQISQVGVGNAPYTVLISPDGQTAYVSNEGEPGSENC